MRIRNRYNVESSSQIISSLDQMKIPYKLLTAFNPKMVQFYLYNDDIRKKEIETHLGKRNMITSELVFSKAEYEKANWYRFMPKYDKIPLCDSDLTYSYFCSKRDGSTDYNSSHRHQTGYCRLSKAPRWPNEKCVLSAEGDYNYIWFTNYATRSLLERADINGLRFDPVIAEVDEHLFENIYQIVFKNLIPEEAIALGKDFGVTSIYTCTSCQERRYYVSSGTYQLCLYEQFLENNKDVYMTKAVFGQGYGYHIVIGSKRFYRFVKDNDLDKYFKIHPVKLLYKNQRTQ